MTITKKARPNAGFTLGAAILAGIDCSLLLYFFCIQLLPYSLLLARKQVFWQRSHHASLVHDALYQYLHTLPISKTAVDQLFYDMLCDSLC